MAYPYRGRPPMGRGGPPMGYPGGPPPPHYYQGPGPHPGPHPGGYMPHPAEYDEFGGPPPVPGPMYDHPHAPPPSMGRGYTRPPRPAPGPGGGRVSGSDTDGGGVGSATEYESDSSRPADGKCTNDCEIVVLSRAHQRYAEKMEKDLRKNGLKVDLMFPKPDVKLSEFLKPIAKTGIIFAAVIDPECEAKGTIHFYQFRGVPKPTYHKNLRPEQAFKMMRDIYDAQKREEIGMVPESMKVSLNKIMKEQHLEDADYTALIKFLQERKRRQHAFFYRKSNIIPDHSKSDIDSLVDSKEGKELQQQILNILNEESILPDKKQ